MPLMMDGDTAVGYDDKPAEAICRQFCGVEGVGCVGKRNIECPFMTSEERNAEHTVS
jgi:hypothetical protein